MNLKFKALKKILVYFSFFACSLGFSNPSSIDNETINMTIQIANDAYSCTIAGDSNCQMQYPYKGETYVFQMYRHKPLIPIGGSDSSSNSSSSGLGAILEKYLGLFKVLSSADIDFLKNLKDFTPTILPKFEDDTAVLFSYNENTKIAFIAFRGTYSLSNALTDFNDFNTEFFDSNTHVLEGFYNYLLTSLASNVVDNSGGLTLEDQITKAANDGANFIVTGHSLGAAIVPLFGAYLNYKLNVDGERIKLVSYAEPTAFQYDFAKKFQDEFPYYIRFHNIGDPSKKLSIIGDPIPNSTIIFLTHHFGYNIVISEDYYKKSPFPIPKNTPADIVYLLSLHSMHNYKAYILENYTVNS